MKGVLVAFMAGIAVASFGILVGAAAIDARVVVTTCAMTAGMAAGLAIYLHNYVEMD